MNKQARIISAICAILSIVIVVLVLLNQDNAQVGKQTQEERTFTICIDGKELAKLDEEFIKEQESKTFPVVIRSSGGKPEEAEYTGVELKTLLKAADVDLKGKKQLVFSAVDSYVVAVAVSEIEEQDNVYLAYAMNGEDLLSKKQNGNGPYQLVIRKDPFSQRWCKYVVEVDIQ